MKETFLLTGGHLLDPALGLDAKGDIGFDKGRLVAPESLPADAQRIDASGLYVAPGFIDLHTHVYWGGTSLGVLPEKIAAQGGVTTLIDAGSAGPGNFAGFRAHVIEPSPTRILAWLHVSFAGIFAFSRQIMVGESANLALISPADALRVAQANRDLVIGIKVRVGRFASGDSGLAPLLMAREVADEAGLPLMVHIDHPPPGYDEVLAVLKKGDTLTHAFRPFPNSPLAGSGAIRDSVLAARKAGIRFDIGHGMGSLSFAVAERMLDQGFPPDTISSDIHDLNQGGPVHDQAVTLTKFLSLGMSLPDVIRATTSAAADAINRPDLGTLKAGSVGDATLFRIEDRAIDLVDSLGIVRRSERQIAIAGRICAGELRWAATGS